MKTIDLLSYLARDDKWYLGGGNRLLWAPPFPLFLDYPGFWDKAHYYNYELEPLFTWTLLTEDGKLVELSVQKRIWNPSIITQSYSVAMEGKHFPLSLTEEKTLLPNDVAASTLHLANTSKKTIVLHLIAWSAQDNYPSKQSSWVNEVTASTGGCAFTKFLRPSVAPHLAVGCALTLSHEASSYGVNLSESTAKQPHWRLTPFYETFRNGRLPNEVQLDGVTNDGLLYIALHKKVMLKSGAKKQITAAFAASPSQSESLENLQPIQHRRSPAALSTMNWKEYFGTVPGFTCSDDYLTRYYWYRWYGLKLNTQYGNEGNYKRPFVCEGIGYFRAPITYSAQGHIVETRWMHDPELARGILQCFIDNQRDDGGFRGYIDVNHYRNEMFYHANWGNSLLQLHSIHPSLEYLQEVFDGLKRYVGYFDKERDEEVSGLYDIDNHYETGQEYMHRYLAVDLKADQDNWGIVFRLKGVDVTVYLYELKKALAHFADLLGKNDEADLWNLEAARIKTAILSIMWDPDQEMFFDVDPATGKRTQVKATTCFYPYFTDIVDASHLAGLKRHLFNPNEFWTPYPVPSSSVDDKYFSDVPHWKGKRMNCPWNGRVWPMTNSHIAEALASCAIRFHDGELRKKAVEFISTYIKMLFFDGNPKKPNCFEHYNPFSGKPSSYRGIDDYQHSVINDLILKYVCGIRPEEYSVTIDPFPFGLKTLTIDRVKIRERMLRVQIAGDKFTVWIDEKLHADSRIGKPIEVQI
ncbi:MAG: trehalase family glycosidase [bacterium]